MTIYGRSAECEILENGEEGDLIVREDWHAYRMTFRGAATQMGVWELRGGVPELMDVWAKILNSLKAGDVLDAYDAYPKEEPTMCMLSTLRIYVARCEL